MRTLLLSLFVASILVGQTTGVGGMATTPDVTSALNSWIAGQAQLTATTGGTVGSADTTITLPAAFTATNPATGQPYCSESYSVVTLSSASNTSTANVQTYQVPISTRVTISGSLTAAYNSTFATTSASSSSSGLTFALTIADGTYSNASPSTNGYPALTYNRCAVLIDSEVIGIQGTTDGANYTATRGDLGTTAAAHSSGATITLLKYSGIRGLYRSNAATLVQNILSTVTTPRQASILSQIATLQAQLAALRLVAQ